MCDIDIKENNVQIQYKLKIQMSMYCSSTVVRGSPLDSILKEPHVW